MASLAERVADRLLAVVVPRVEAVACQCGTECTGIRCDTGPGGRIRYVRQFWDCHCTRVIRSECGCLT